eukprot:2290004-Pyramimonas_sp.AAC.1
MLLQVRPCLSWTRQFLLRQLGTTKRFAVSATARPLSSSTRSWAPPRATKAWGTHGGPICSPGLRGCHLEGSIRLELPTSACRCEITGSRFSVLSQQCAGPALLAPGRWQNRTHHSTFEDLPVVGPAPRLARPASRRNVRLARDRRDAWIWVSAAGGNSDGLGISAGETICPGPGVRVGAFGISCDW